MKTISQKTVHGKRRITVEVEDGEQLLSIKPNSFYKLGGQLDDIVASHVIEEMGEVSWCSIEQKWVEI